MKKNLAFIIKANQDFVRHTEADIKNTKPILNGLFESISKVYIPLLDMLENFMRENLKVKIGLVLPPVLCSLLTDEEIKTLYIQHLDERNQLGKEELLRFKDDEKITKIIEKEIEHNLYLKNIFENTLKKDIISAFSRFVKSEYVELIGTFGTDLFIPHYADMKEIISAQVESGLHSYRQYFDNLPDGFWLPEFGYTPGAEKLIKAYGYSYTILDARSLLLSEKLPSKGIFYPVRAENSLVFFANDPDCYDDVFSEEDGFVTSKYYRNENRDIGFELDVDSLKCVMGDCDIRFSTGFKYWNKDFVNENSPLGYYDSDLAAEQAKKDAVKFVSKRAEILKKASEITDEADTDFVEMVCAFTSDDLKSWNESMIWFEEVLRQVGQNEEFGLNSVFCKNMLEKQYELEKITPYFSAGNSSSSSSGYGEKFLSNKNSWMMRYVRKACERIVDLADRFPNDTGLKTRLLNLGAKELMLAQSLNLPKMIEDENYADYAIKRFKDSIEAFTIVFDSLGSNTVSTEWLTTLEVRDSFFPWMNYRIFSKKK